MCLQINDIIDAFGCNLKCFLIVFIKPSDAVTLYSHTLHGISMIILNYVKTTLNDAIDKLVSKY